MSLSKLPSDRGGADDLVAVRLVPVEVFGTDGYGLMDAVEAWSDCNRAIGRIYRVDDMPIRQDGETIEVLVRRADLPWFEKRWGDDD